MSSIPPYAFQHTYFLYSSSCTNYSMSRQPCNQCGSMVTDLVDHQKFYCQIELQKTVKLVSIDGTLWYKCPEPSCEALSTKMLNIRTHMNECKCKECHEPITSEIPRKTILCICVQFWAESEHHCPICDGTGVNGAAICQNSAHRQASRYRGDTFWHKKQ